jgi:hypothetical protein
VLAVTAALLSPATTQALDPTREALVTLGPAGGLEAQIRYLTTNWPNQHAIAVVTAEAPARCHTGSADKVYCTQIVRLNESVLIRWLEASPQAPGARFVVHYWYGPAQGAVAIGPGEDLLVFLAPTHAPGTYSCTVLMRATDAVVRDVREALRTLEGR